jgi:hypothetical protein
MLSVQEPVLPTYYSHLAQPEEPEAKQARPAAHNSGSQPPQQQPGPHGAYGPPQQPPPSLQAQPPHAQAQNRAVPGMHPGYGMHGSAGGQQQQQPPPLYQQPPSHRPPHHGELMHACGAEPSFAGHSYNLMSRTGQGVLACHCRAAIVASAEALPPCVPRHEQHDTSCVQVRWWRTLMGDGYRWVQGSAVSIFRS